MSQWTTVCQLNDILPATGVCALVGNQQVAIFRPRNDDQVFALSNIDPFFEASVLSRGCQPVEKAAFQTARRIVHGR